MSAMKSLLLLLPILRLATAQQPTTVVSAVAATSTVTASPSVANDGSTGVAVTATIEPSNSAISVFSGSGPVGTAAAPTTTIDFSVISENGTAITLTFTGTVTPVGDTTVYINSLGSVATSASSSKGSGTGATSSTRTGAASTTGTGPAQYTNAASGADVQFALGFLGFAGAAVALGL